MTGSTVNNGRIFGKSDRKAKSPDTLTVPYLLDSRPFSFALAANAFFLLKYFRDRSDKSRYRFTNHSIH